MVSNLMQVLINTMVIILQYINALNKLYTLKVE